ncbi:1-acyl-sn-glycerol-3-phosphate acyltransferases [Pseudonocardia ammonioxydans]|uniref:1-acyl-sn-glycerol-3-phosphate acyltransferases n=1 Tax=Pseudonocardia ammonioxydans TaxID=260086 RepID=A0A1I5CL25_PSUAM|nr:lysophospholipid acyltransferase family protein [Pseudonocardia ammonioxydans]SFN87592.1 1-acyl-sn-glycerol-3-phosphate acyltransferases [Pseudonocardia ammonioxydans]
MAREKGGFWVGLAATMFYPLGWLTGRQRYQGREHLPATGGALLVSNHVSYLDPLHTSLFVHSAGRVPRFLAKNSLWKVPVLGPILRGSGQIPVFRDTADAQQSLAAGTRALADGKIVVIYPEGTITRDPAGWPMHSRTGVARLALASDVPVVPMVHWGTREVYDHYGKRFRPLPRTDLVLRAGDPVDLSGYRGRPLDATVLREVTDLIMSRVRDLLAEVREETAPTEFYRRSPEREAG